MSFCLPFAGQTAVAIGGGSGIGKSTCNALASEGALVVVADISLETARTTAQSLPEISQHLAIQVDVGSSQSVKALFETVGRECKVPPSIVVNCAGIMGARRYLTETPEDDFDNVVRVNLKIRIGFQLLQGRRKTAPWQPLQIDKRLSNLPKLDVDEQNEVSDDQSLLSLLSNRSRTRHKGTFLVTQAAAQAIITGNIRDGCIVNVASIRAKWSVPRFGVYSATKAAVVAMTKVAAKELASQGIRVNVVLPNTIDTPLVQPVFTENPDQKARIAARIPLGRIGRPEEVSEVIKFLCGKGSSFMTGAAVDISGGAV